MVSMTFKFPKFFIERYKRSGKTIKLRFLEILVELNTDRNFHRFLENYSSMYIDIYLSEKQRKFLKNLKEKYGLTYNELVLLTLVYWYGVRGEII